MIPSSFIFEEAPATASLREQAHGIATRLLLFVLIGAGAAVFYAFLAHVLVPAFPEIADWQMQLMLFASLLVPAYQVHRRFCFPSNALHRQAVPRYLVVQIGVLGLAVAFSHLAYGVVGLPHLTTLFLVFGLTAGVNFSILRVWAFTSH